MQQVTKQQIAQQWGFVGTETTMGFVGYRNAPAGWIEVWRSVDPDCIALYNNTNTERTADETHTINWSLFI